MPEVLEPRFTSHAYGQDDVSGAGRGKSGTGRPRITEITDGTSKTIMALQTTPDSAVIWTKPDDIEIDQKNPIRGLVNGNHRINAAFGDCHVEGIAPTIKPSSIWAMFTRNAGDKADQ